jgi:hypothetical protein
VTAACQWLAGPRLRMRVHENRCRDDSLFIKDPFFPESEDEGIPALYLRIHLKNEGHGAAKNCRVSIEHIRFNGVELDYQSSVLPWADTETYDSRRIEAGHDVYLNLASFYRGQSHSRWMLVFSQQINKTIFQPGLYVFEVAARADWPAVTEKRTFDVLHSGWRSIFLPTPPE